jgi:hypothetical protein
MNFLLLSSGFGLINIPVNLKQTCWSTHLKKSFFGGLGINLKMYPSESYSEPIPLCGGIIISK